MNPAGDKRYVFVPLTALKDFVVGKLAWIALAMVLLLLLLAFRGGGASARPTLATANHIVISEVLYNATAPEPDREWIELYNPTASNVVLDGWSVSDDVSPVANEGKWIIPDPNPASDDYVLAAGCFVAIAHDASDFKGLYGRCPDFARKDDASLCSGTTTLVTNEGSLALNNNMDQVYLRDASGTLIDAVGWGTPQDDDKLIFPLGSGESDGESILRNPAGEEGTENSGPLSEVLSEAWALAGDITYSEEGPTAQCQTLITLASFTAAPQPNGVLLEWETASEVDNAGFNLWRGETEAGPYTRLNADLIPARGGPTIGARYSYRDEAVTKGVTYWYKLEDVDLHGTRTMHGPVRATALHRHWLHLPLVLKGRDAP